MRACCRAAAALIGLLMVAGPLPAAPRPQWIKLGDRPADQRLAAYFKAETAGLRDACLADVKTLDDWKAKRETYRKQLLEMLGLDPMPPKTDLKATVTGTTERDDFVVEKLHFQSRPKLYVTANLYRPKKLDKPAPAILYVCGHGGVKIDGVSYGNKVSYHHHGCWFARHGYVCLTIDSLQLGEIEGIHHGTYRYGMWWWNNRGYTPAGVEAWNCIRALDYLQSRKEVDPERFGVTGRSGGGAYSWWIAAIDERIKAAVPVAGITDLENHVVDGCAEGHCDCMYFVNTYRWDYPMLPALVAPRPLMIGNSDDDAIFPLDGVKRTYKKARRIYELYGAGEDIALNITEGGHRDTRELRVPAFKWFDKHLKGIQRDEYPPAEKMFKPEELKVFDSLPEDAINAKIHETFVPVADPPKVPESKEAWAGIRDGWMRALREKSFGGWPQAPLPLDVKKAFTAERRSLRLTAYDFASQENVRLRLFLVAAADGSVARVLLNVLDEDAWKIFLAMMRPAFETELREYELPEANEELLNEYVTTARDLGHATAYIAPRGVGPSAWNPNERKQVQIRRRFMLLGQTRDAMRVWDVRRAIQVLRTLETTREAPLELSGDAGTAGVTLLASLFEPRIERVKLQGLPTGFRDGPILLNARRFLDMPQILAMTTERSRVVLLQPDTSGWEYPKAVADKLDWGDGGLQLRDEAEAGSK